MSIPWYKDELEALLDHTESRRQREVIAHLAETLHGPTTEEHFGLRRGSVAAMVRRVKSKAAKRGYVPEKDMSRAIPEPYYAKGFTFTDKIDPDTGQWTNSIRHTKLDVDKAARAEMFAKAVEKRCEGVQPLPAVDAPEIADDDLLNLYTLSDYHLGMLAWGPETGADWDIQIAKDLAWKAISGMISRSPDAQTAVVCFLGDFCHADGSKPFTPTSGHLLDVDGRWPRVVDAAIEIIESCVVQALGKHKRVVLLIGEGNHDMDTTVWLRKMFKRLFRDNPRVRVIDSERPYYAYQHGETMLFWHHSHLKKKEDLHKVASFMFSEIWGRTKRRYGHTGHYHHKHQIKEDAGWTLTQHQTLASPDAHAARHAYTAERRATAQTYHREHGEIQTVSVTPEMLRAQ